LLSLVLPLNNSLLYSVLYNGFKFQLILCYGDVASMCYMSGSIEMENTYTPEQEVGVLQWILGKSVSSVVLRNTGQNDGFVGIAAPYLARILPIDLAMFGGEILCQPDAFLCSVHDVKVVNSVDQRARNIVAAGAEVRTKKENTLIWFLMQLLFLTKFCNPLSGFYSQIAVAGISETTPIWTRSCFHPRRWLW